MFTLLLLVTILLVLAQGSCNECDCTGGYGCICSGGCVDRIIDAIDLEAMFGTVESDDYPEKNSEDE